MRLPVYKPALSSRRTRAAFTLVELLVVIAIIAMLALPTSHSSMAMSRASQALFNLPTWSGNLEFLIRA